MHNTNQHTPRTSIPIGVYVAASIVALLLIAGLVAIFFREWLIFSASAPEVAWLLRFLVFALPVSLAAGAGYAGLAIWWRRFGWRESIAAHYAIMMKRAEVQIAPLAQTFTYNPRAEELPSVDQLALPPPVDVVKELDDWMRWADEQPHILLAGKTKAGKTHLATAILERRLRAGETIFIIDPHSSGWLNLPTAGGVANQNELKFALVALLSEYTRRMQERENFKKANNGAELPHDHFGRMTVLIDECNAIAGLMSTVWNTFATQLASGSRKVGIALLILAQSPNVEDIGFNAKMRNNFAAIALDDASVQYLIDRERDKPRKVALRESAHGTAYPAASLIGADVWLLDRSSLPAGRAPAGALSLMWGGWDYAQGRAVSALSSETPLSPTTRIDNDVSTPVISPGADVSPVAPVIMQAAEIAQIATLLMTLSPSEAAKKVDGYNGRNYREIKTKVDSVKQLIEGVQ